MKVGLDSQIEQGANTDKIIKELRNLKRKTRLMQYCQGEMAETYSNWARWLNRATTLFAGLAVIATTVEAKLLVGNLANDIALQRLAACFSIAVFLLMILRLDSHWSTAAGEYANGLKAYTRFLRRIDLILESLDGKSVAELEEISKGLSDEYSDVCEASPTIPSKKFLRLKQSHLQIYELSRALDENPFVDLKQLRHKLNHTDRS